jgi:hypothetical protein
MPKPSPPSARRVFDLDAEHVLKNHLAIILGYLELLLADMPPDDPRRADLQEVQDAARAMMAVFNGAQP